MCLVTKGQQLRVKQQDVSGNLTAHPYTLTHSWGYSASNETPLSKAVHCVAVAFTMTELDKTEGKLRKKQKGQKEG